jgi:hypothetical protein
MSDLGEYESGITNKELALQMMCAVRPTSPLGIP